MKYRKRAIKLDGQHTLMNPAPLLRKIKSFISKAHTDKNMTLELFLMSLKEQIKELSKQKCVVILEATCTSRAEKYPKTSNDMRLTVNVCYSKGEQPNFVLRCRGKAAEVARLPLEKGDKIRVVGSMHSHWVAFSYTSLRYYILADCIELIKRGPKNTENTICLP
jgi:hypothetical protein